MVNLREGKNYLVIGNIHLGYSEKILKVLRNISSNLDAEVIHLGTLVTADEIKVYSNRVKRVRALEKELELSKGNQLKLKKIKLKENNYDIRQILSAQARRINKLKTVFKKVSYIINKEQYIGDIVDHLDVLGKDCHLSKYIMLSSVSANGEKISYSPITDRSFQYFMTKSSSFVVPHPTPCIKSFNKAGVNNARLFATTGCLKDPEEPLRASELHKVVNDPSAILLTIDPNGEFHLTRLSIEYVENEPCCLFDGLMFDSTSITELPSEDRALVSSDDHAPYHSIPVLRSVQALSLLMQPNTFINAGDAGDFPSVCPHNKNNLKAQEGRRLVDDINSLRGLLIEQARFMPEGSEKILIDSNHHKWLTRLVEQNPVLIGILDWKTVMKSMDGFKVFLEEDREIYKFGDLVIRHGHQERSLTNGHKTFYKYLCGHWHSYNDFRGLAASMGAGCGLEPEYLDGAMTSWTNTVTTLTKYKGKTRYSIKPIMFDETNVRFVFQGQIYEVQYNVKN